MADRQKPGQSPTLLASYLTGLLIRFYQFLISPLMGTHCRFSPRCSDYALSALKTFGFLTACWLITKRLLKCNPWCQGGYDPLPGGHFCQYQANMPQEDKADNPVVDKPPIHQKNQSRQ